MSNIGEAKRCEVCGTTEGRIRGKSGKYGKDMCDKCYYVAQTHEQGRQCSQCGETEGRIYTSLSKFGKELCGKCYSVFQKEVGTGKACEVCKDTDGYIQGKSGKHRMDLCSKHYAQMDKYGYTLDRTRYEPNEICICNGYAEVILYDFYSNEVARTTIDIEDIDRVLSKKWYLNKETGYVQCNTEKNSTTLHRFIMGASGNTKIDHKDTNRLNNTKLNLRIATSSQNNMNRRIQSNNTSGYTGIRKRKDKWYACIKINGNTLRFGTYDNLQDAIKVRQEAVEKYFGEFAYKGAM